MKFAFDKPWSLFCIILINESEEVEYLITLCFILLAASESFDSMAFTFTLPAQMPVLFKNNTKIFKTRKETSDKLLNYTPKARSSKESSKRKTATNRKHSKHISYEN